MPSVDGASFIAFGTYLFKHENELNLVLGAIWIGSSYLNGFLQAISGIFMLLALNKIKAVLRHGIEAD